MKELWIRVVFLAFGLAGVASPDAAGAVALREGNTPITMAALPFQNKSGDEDLDWLSLGILSVLEADLLRSTGLDVIPVSRQLADAEPEEGCAIDGEELACWQSLGWEDRLRIAEQLGADALLSGELTKGAEDGHLQVTLTLSATGAGAKPESVAVEETLSALPDRLSASLALLLRHRGLPEPPVRRVPWPSSEVWKLHTEALRTVRVLSQLQQEPVGDRGRDFSQFIAFTDGADPVGSFRNLIKERLEPLEQALAIASDDPEILITAGLVKLLEGDFLSTIQVTKSNLEESYRPDPVEKFFLSFIGSIVKSFGVDVDPLDAYGSIINSRARETANSLLQEAAADFQKSLDLEPASIPARIGLGRATGNRQLLEEALALDPARATAHAALARFSERNGDFSSSLAHWQSCLEVSPRNIECRLGRGEMLMAAGRLDEALAPLIDILGTGRRWFRVRAAVDLESIGDRRATAALAQALENGPADLARAVLRSLTALNAKDSVPAIRQAVSDETIRTDAVRALGQLGRKTERSTLVPLLDARSDVPLLDLIAALDRTGSGWLDRQALEQLLALDGEKMLEGWFLLRRQRCAECETYLRSELAKEDKGSPRQLKILLLLTKLTRIRSAQDLQKLPEGSTEMISFLMSLEEQGPPLWDEEAILDDLRSGDEDRFGIRAIFLGRQEIEISEEIRKALRDSLQEGSPEKVVWTLHVLSVAGGESPELYLRYVENQDSLVRSVALRALAEVDGRRAIPYARKALSSEDPGEVLTALDLLAHHDEDGQYCSDFPQKLPQPPVVLLRFLNAWWSLRCPERLPVVLPFLDSGEPQVRLAALRAVWRLKGAAIAPRLREAARDASPAVRALATLYLRHGGEGRISREVLGPVSPSDREDGPFRTELDLLLPDLLPKLSLDEIRSLGQLTDPDFSTLPFSAETLALLHFATAAPRPAKRLAALEALSRRDAAFQPLNRAAILDIWKSAGRALPEERLADNPYLSFFLADTLKEHGEDAEALVWVRKAAASLPASPAEETVLRIALAWVEAESLLYLERGRDALKVLQEVERLLLPETSWFERSRIRLPMSARTLLLMALAEETRGRQREALDLLNEAESLLIEDPDLDGVGRDRERKTLAGFRARIFRTLGGEDAQLALSLTKKYPGRRRLELEAEESAVVTALQVAIGEGDYERAHQLTETYTLRRYLAGGHKGLASGSPGRREIVDELRAMQVGIRELERELSQAERRSVGQGGLPPLERPRDPGESELDNVLRKLRDERRRLKSFTVSLKRDYPEVASLIQAEPVDMAVLQSLLADDQVILQYLLLPERGYLFVLSANNVRILDIPHGRNAIDGWVKTWRTAVEKKEELSDREREEVEAAEKELVAALLAPALPDLERYHNLVIVPNGSLHLLPFSALRVGGRYLAERWTLSRLAAASLLPVVARGIPEDQRLVALASPVYLDWPRLRGAKAEVETIRPYFQRAEVHVGEAACSSVLVDKDLRGVYLHLAVHSKAGGEDGERQGAAPGEGEEETPSQPFLVLSDGLLGIEKVWNLNLDGSPLVVLSSCETQVGERVSGDEVVSLGNGFLFAGARRVVASLWPVSDQATRRLMEALYRHLHDGRPAAEALRLAQGEVRSQPRFAEPFYWAAFVLDGW